MRFGQRTLSSKLQTAFRSGGPVEACWEMRERLTFICALTALTLSVCVTAAATTAAGAEPTGGVSAPSGSQQGKPASPRTTGGTTTSFKAAPKPSKATAKKVVKRAKAKRRLPKKVKPATPRPPTPAPAPAAAGRHLFPVAGAYTFGGADARFGAGRPGHIHQGQDVTAAAGTPLRAITSGTITYRAYQASGAGHYFVLRSSVDGRDYVYMHLREAALYGAGTPVRGGQTLGYVGSTGASSGAHLHFEIWIGGWYAPGGAPVDPLPELRRWAA